MKKMIHEHTLEELFLKEDQVIEEGWNPFAKFAQWLSNIGKSEEAQIESDSDAKIRKLFKKYPFWGVIFNEAHLPAKGSWLRTFFKNSRLDIRDKVPNIKRDAEIFGKRVPEKHECIVVPGMADLTLGADNPEALRSFIKPMNDPDWGAMMRAPTGETDETLFPEDLNAQEIAEVATLLGVMCVLNKDEPANQIAEFISGITGSEQDSLIGKGATAILLVAGLPVIGISAAWAPILAAGLAIAGIASGKFTEGIDAKQAKQIFPLISGVLWKDLDNDNKISDEEKLKSALPLQNALGGVDASALMQSWIRLENWILSSLLENPYKVPDGLQAKAELFFAENFNRELYVELEGNTQKSLEFLNDFLGELGPDDNTQQGDRLRKTKKEFEDENRTDKFHRAIAYKNRDKSKKDVLDFGTGQFDDITIEEMKKYSLKSLLE